jgi:hypothetical protein
MTCLLDDAAKGTLYFVNVYWREDTGPFVGNAHASWEEAKAARDDELGVEPKTAHLYVAEFMPLKGSPEIPDAPR